MAASADDSNARSGVIDWRPLYRIGAAAAIAVLILVPVQMAVLVARPPPRGIADWFALFQTSTIGGLAALDVAMLADSVLFGVMFLGVCVALRRTNPSWVAIALVLEVAALATYLSSNTALEMLSLSRQYGEATTDADRTVLLAAGQAMIERWQGGAFTLGYSLTGLASLIASIVMFKSEGVFTKVCAAVGVVFGALSVVPASAARPGAVLSLSLIPMWAWLALVARSLFGLVRGAEAPSPTGRKPRGPQLQVQR